MLRVAVGQIRPEKGDYRKNLARVASVIAGARALDRPVDLLVFPETVTSGYFVEGGVREVAVTAGSLFRDLRELVGADSPTPDVVVGFYEQFDNRFYNSSAYCTLDGPDAGIRHVHRKVFLPTYGVFDEQRFVDRGHDVRAFDTGWGRAAMLICEDVWHSLVPTIAALDGAQVLIVPSASPARDPAPADGGGERIPKSVARWRQIIRSIAEEHSVFVVLGQLVGFEGGKGFPGGSLVVAPDGNIISAAPVFEEALLVADVDFDVMTRVRSEQPLLADFEAELPHLMTNLNGSRPDEVRWGDASGTAPHIRVLDGKALPTVGGSTGRDPLAIDGDLLTHWLTEFLRDEVTRRRRFDKGIVALSGGVDSSLTAYLAVLALGADNVIGLSLPHRTSSQDSVDHAALVATQLGIDLLTVDISAVVDGYVNAIAGATDGRRLGNVMARTRMIALFDHSAAHGALPLGTGNKTERLLGYFTWHADDSPPVNPLGDLFKTQVWRLAEHLGVPAAIVSKPATADLVVGQTDEADLGVSYENADRILHWLLQGFDESDIERLGFARSDVKLVSSRLGSTHWKRRLPTVAMVSQTAIGEYYLRPVDY